MRRNPADVTAPAPGHGRYRSGLLLVLALGSAAVALVVVSVTARRTYRALEASSVERQGAYEMLVALRLLRQHIGESRVGLTGYALTRDTLYRLTYRRAVAEFGNDTARLGALTHHRPELVSLLEPIASAVAAYADDLAATFRTVEGQTLAAAGVELRQIRSTLLLEGTRTRVVALEEALYRLLNRSAMDVRESLRRAGAVVTWVLLLSGLVIAGAGGAVFVQLHAREQVEVRLRRLNEQLEERVRQRTADLAATNEELEAFVSSVSHDLRAPVRSIHGLTDILLSDHIHQLDGEGLDHLGRVRAAAHRMGQLIDDLLTLARVSREEMRHEPVDLSALARAVLAELLQRSPARRLEVDVADGVVAQGDARLLRVVLENLLGNAWKFTRDQPHPRIEFGTVERNGRRFYRVRDNGAGFDMSHADRLFSPFQRLHSTTEFEGTGIGLTTVHRIISRHGGQVVAEGAVGQGATVAFTLGES